MPTERDFQSWIECQIREATERGEFDNLPGSGKPIPGIDGTYDPDWWGKGFVTREKVRARADAVRKMIRDELPRLRIATDRVQASGRVAELNEMIEDINGRLPPDDQIESITI